MLKGDVRKNLRQVIFKYKIIAVFRVRTYNIRRKFGGKFVMRVISFLKKKKKFGVFKFSYIVVIGARSRKKGILVNRRRARFG